MITILNFKEKSGSGALQATFSISFPTKNWGTLTFNELTLFKKDNQRWISFPSKQYEKDGVKKYYSYIFADNENLKRDILKAVDDSLHKQSPSVKSVPDMASQFIPVDKLHQQDFF